MNKFLESRVAKAGATSVVRSCRVSFVEVGSTSWVGDSCCCCFCSWMFDSNGYGCVWLGESLSLSVCSGVSPSENPPRSMDRSTIQHDGAGWFFDVLANKANLEPRWAWHEPCNSNTKTIARDRELRQIEDCIAIVRRKQEQQEPKKYAGIGW